MPDTTHTIHYGQEELQFSIPGATYLDTLDITDSPALEDQKSALLEGLANPVGMTGHAFDNFQASDTVAIVVSDSFRQTKIDELLPDILSQLTERGIDPKNITFTFSTGTHRGPTPEEAIQILGDEVAADYAGQIYSHEHTDRDNLVHVGTTSRDTPVEVNKRVHESDRIILTGSVVLHYFGGFGGGRKSMVPGIASTKTIAHNHAMNLHPSEDVLDPNVQIGRTTSNPVAEDMLEATQLSHVDCIVNTILNRNNEIAHIFVGDLVEAHEAACATAYDTFASSITERSDIVIAASPSTKNFVQTHKALFNAYQAVKPEGRIILLTPCPEGIGGEQFKKWLRLGDRASIIAGLRKESEINGQTALSTREKAPIMLMLTEMIPEEVAMLGATKVENLDQAIQSALESLTESGISAPTYRLMPSAPYSVPVLAS